MFYLRRRCCNWKFISIVILINFSWSVANDSQASGEDDDVRTVELESGRIRGKQNTTLFDEKPYFSFRGIPFARPPINELRFRAPQKVLPWLETLDAFEFGSDCIQPNLETFEYFGSEDCLFLNVYVPSEAFASAENAKLPVMVYIPGWLFYAGSARFYGPDFLLDKGVIVVTLNYRLGPLGFMSLNLPDYSGNMGLKDQLLALKWVNKNIEQFGGDNKKITMFGHSSGSACVNLHTISPASRGLFQRAIMLSGSALNPGAFREKDHLSILYHLAENVHYPVDNNKDLLLLLKQINGTILAKKTLQDEYNSGLGRKVMNLIWAPVVEHPHAVEPFLSKTPFTILTDKHFKSDVDTLFGSTFQELYGTFPEAQDPELLKPFDEIFETQLPLKNAKLKFHTKQYKEVSEKIRNFYFNGKRVDGQTLNEFSALMTDVVYLYGIDLSARIQANKSTGLTYYSTFSVKTDWNLSSRRAKLRSIASNYSQHIDQLPYIFRLGGESTLTDSIYTSLDRNSMPRKIIDIVTKFYTNFAKIGNPLPRADPITFKTSAFDQYNYIDITNAGLVVKINPIKDRIDFWDRIFEDYSSHWQIREFNLNSLAVKIPLALLAFLLTTILCCKVMTMCFRRKKKVASVE